MTNIHHHLQRLAIPAMLFSIANMCSLLGGFIIAAKTGVPPQGIWWSEVPALSSGIVAVICQSIIGFNAIADDTLSPGIRIILGTIWSFTFGALVLILPIYFIAAAQRSSIQLAIESLLESNTTGLLTWLSYFLLICTMELVIPGTLVAIGARRKADIDTALATQLQATQAAAVATNAQQATTNRQQLLLTLTPAQRAIYELLAAAINVGMTGRQLQDETSMEQSTVYNACTALERLELVSHSKPGRVKVYEVTR